MTGEGLDGITWPASHEMDTRGLSWRTSDHSGVCRLSFYDLCGSETLSLNITASVNSHQFSYDQSLTFLAFPATDADRTESHRDLKGRLREYRSPIWFRDKRDPTQLLEHDRWDNVTREINSLNQVTDKVYNHANQCIQLTEPMVTVVDEHGVRENKRPVIKFGFNATHHLIGSTDGNSHTTGYRLDEANQQLDIILGDGTRTESRVLGLASEVLSIKNSRNDKMSYIYDATRSLKETRYPSGRTETYGRDERGHRISVTDALGNMTRYDFDERDNIVLRVLPGGQATSFAFDHQHQPLRMNYLSNGEPWYVAWQRDYFGNELSRKDISGQEHISTYDGRYRLTSITSTKGHKRDTAYLEEKVIDLSGSPLIPHDSPFYFEGYQYTAKKKPAGDRHIHHQYQYGLLTDVIDHGLGKHAQYEHDTESRRIRMIEKKLDTGVVVRDMQIEFDALGRESKITDNHSVLTNFHGKIHTLQEYDGDDNKRHVHIEFKASPYAEHNKPFPSKESDIWSKYDAADRLQLNGSLVNGEIVPAVDQSGYGYDGDFRISEITRVRDHHDISATLTYNHDSQLEGSVLKRHDKEPLERKNLYGRNGLLSEIKETRANNNVVAFNHQDHRYVYTADGNGWLYQDHADEYITIPKMDYRNDIRSSTVHHEVYQPSGEILHKKYVLREIASNQHTTIDYDHGYLPTDHYQLTEITMKRKGVEGTGKAWMLYDVNGTLNGKFNSEDEWRFPGDLTPDGVFYDTTTEGLLRTKYNLSEMRKHGSGRDVVLDHYLHNGSNEPYAFYKMKYVPAEHKVHDIKKFPHQDIAYYASNIVPIHPVNPVTLPDFTKQAKPNPEDFHEQSFVQPGPQIYIVKTGDTLASIAEKLYDDPFFAKEIAKVNGLFGQDFRLLPESILNLPQIMPCRNKAGMSLAYHRFVSVISGSLSPHLVILPKKEHHSFFAALVKVIALAIVLLAAPYLAGVGLSALGMTTVGAGLQGVGAMGAASLTSLSTAQMTGAMIATGVVAGIGDAAVQGLAISFGVQSHFSINEMLETGITAGVGLSLAGKAFTVDNAMRALMKVGVANVSAQLMEMQLGTRDKFDGRAALMQVSATVLSMGMNHLINPPKNLPEQVIQQTFKKAVNTVLGTAITHTPADIQQFAAEMIGDSVVDVAANQLSVNEQPIPSLQEAMDNQVIADFLKSSPQDHFFTSSPQDHFFTSSPQAPTWHDTLSNPSLSFGSAARQLSEMNLARMAQEKALQTPMQKAANARQGSGGNPGFFRQKPVNTVAGQLTGEKHYQDQIEAIYSHLTPWEKGVMMAAGVGEALYSHGPAIYSWGREFYSHATPLEKGLMLGAGVGIGAVAAVALLPAATISGGIAGVGYVGSALTMGGVISDIAVINTFADISLLQAAGGVGVGGAAIAGVSAVGSKLVSKISTFGSRARGAERAINIGGRQLTSTKAVISADREASNFYNQVRASKSNADVIQISKNTGIPEYRIQRIKEHVFINEHTLSGGRVAQFDPYIEISDAWSGLQSGNFVKQDIQLLHHEYFETRFEWIFKSDKSEDNTDPFLNK